MYVSLMVSGCRVSTEGLDVCVFGGFCMPCQYRGLRCLCLWWLLAAVSVQRAEMSVSLMVSGCRVGTEG